MDAEFIKDFTEESNRRLYEALHPKGLLLAEGHDNFGELPPISAEEIHPDQVRRDVAYSLRASA